MRQVIRVVGVSARDLSDSQGSKVPAPVGQQYDASTVFVFGSGQVRSGRHAVGCEPPGQTGGAVTCLFVIGGSMVPAQVVFHRRIGVVLVVPDQSHNILVYLQPAAPVPTLIRRRKACSATSSLRSARCNLGSNVVSRNRLSSCE